MADHGDSINASLGERLIRLQELPGLTDQGFDSLVRPSDMQRVRSFNGRLSTFQLDSSIHALRTDSTSTRYACIGQVSGCSTCCWDILAVMERTNDSVYFHHPAFAEMGADRQSNGAFTPSYLQTTRYGDGLMFEYDPSISTLTYVYVADDLTPIATNTAEDAGEISVSLRRNGEWLEEE